MLQLFVVAASMIAAALGVAVVRASTRAAVQQRELQEASERLALARHDLAAAQHQLTAAQPAIAALDREVEETRAVCDDLTRKIEEAHAEDVKKSELLDNQDEDIVWFRAELEKRPKVTRRTYKILTIGVKWTGKTSLTLKWANPLVDLGALEGSKIERYERTVSQVVLKDVTTEHVFEVGDWGGEHIVDAQQESITDEIHGMLIVVDLGGKDAKAVEPARIQDQLSEFQAQSLKFFFTPKTVASCKTVVLFINKSDLLGGTPAEVEVKAKNLYSKLIDDLMKYQSQIDVHVLVGSATYGHSTIHLFSHFVEKIRSTSSRTPTRRARSPSATSPGTTRSTSPVTAVWR